MSNLETVVLDHDCLAIGRFLADKANGDVVFGIERIAYRIHEYTPEMRERAYRMRGREGFSYGKSVCVLPSAHFYRRKAFDDNLEEVNEECLEIERDDED